MLPWKRSRDHNILDIVLLIFADLGDGSGNNVSITNCMLTVRLIGYRQIKVVCSCVLYYNETIIYYAKLVFTKILKTLRAHDDAWCEVLLQLSPAFLLLQ